ncbi:MAG: glycosyltransferase [Bacteroidota bacterium]
MNILYIASPNSVHDLKWISWFSNNPDNTVYLLSEVQNWKNTNDNLLSFIKENKINSCDPIPAFSFLKPFEKKQTIRNLRNFCADKKIDIVHALFATPNAMWAYHCGVKYIITTRGSDVMQVLPEMKAPPFKLGYLKLLFGLYKKVFKNAIFITSTSLKQKESVRSLFGRSDSKIIRTGIDVQAIADIINRDTLPTALQSIDYVISPRWINPLYNTTTQAKAISTLNPEIISRYTFVFFRNFSTTNAYQQETEEILKHAKVKYIIFDSLPQKEMMACIRFASLCFMIPDRDGTPNSALEAMAARCPLIVGDFEYDIDLFKNTCVRLIKNTPEMLSEAITNSLQNYPEEMKENAYAAVSRCGNRPIEMSKIWRLYMELIAKN